MAFGSNRAAAAAARAAQTARNTAAGARARAGTSGRQAWEAGVGGARSARSSGGRAWESTAGARSATGNLRGAGRAAANWAAPMQGPRMPGQRGGRVRGWGNQAIHSRVPVRRGVAIGGAAGIGVVGRASGSRGLETQSSAPPPQGPMY